MSELKKHFERLMEFAIQSNFHKPFSQVYFVEGKSIQGFYGSNKICELFRQDIFTFETYESRFNELLNQGYSWINMHFAGILNNNLLIVIEIPNYENTIKFTSINLSGPSKKVTEKDYSLDSFIKIV